MRKKRAAAAILMISLLAAVLTGCGGPALPAGAEANGALQKFSGYLFDAFDTVITVTAYCKDQTQFDGYMEAAEEEFLRYHRLFDIYHTYPGMNNLKTVNDAAGRESVTVDGAILELLTLGREMYERTGGRVNVAMGSVLRIWHDIREYNTAFPDDKRLPEREALLAAAEHCDINDMVLDAGAGAVFLRDGEMSLDVGALAKGFAAERVTELLSDMGCGHFAINAGGNVRVRGGKPGEKDWVVAVTNPTPGGGDTSLGSVSLANGSVVTSGSYQRFFEYEGRSYHHIVDGDTLQPENRYLSVTVVTEDSGYADGLSTALFNMDWEEGFAFASGLEGVEVLWVLPDGEQRSTDGLELQK